MPVWYRRRWHNTGRKAGNVEEFVKRWGGRYDYMIVLDADSVMSGAALVELIRRMEADPKLGLLQAPITLHRGETLLASVERPPAADDRLRARPLRRVIQSELLNQLAKEMIAGKLSEGDHVKIKAHDLGLRVEKA